jgi:hypothetical protein
MMRHRGAPTRNELHQLARYWATEIIDLDYDFFLYGGTGSSEWRVREFANRRLSTMCTLLGADVVENIVSEAEQAFGKTVDQRAWKVFMQGNPKEHAQFQREVEDRIGSDHPSHREQPHSRESLQRAYDMYEQGATHFSVTKETGLDRETAEWISNRQLNGLGLPADRTLNITDAKKDEL